MESPSPSHALPQSSPSPPQQPLSALSSKGSEMEFQARFAEEDPSSSIWDFGYLLDFAVDDQLEIPLDFDRNSDVPRSLELPSPEPPSSDRVRKRDPRLICSNFLAGRVPCACPEMDEKLEEEEAGLPGKKRARTMRSPSGVVRCQVPVCQADISELKGYHKRHRVCLRCANATTVFLGGETKRYCQQCGKFHLLSDFDEGKRSCRRKLERHNRRRRKAGESVVAVEPEPQGVIQIEDASNDGGNASSYLSDQLTEKGSSLDNENGQVNFVSSAPNGPITNCDSIASFVASGETKISGGKDHPSSLSPSYCDNKNAYSSMCPTGRISFKLYDWNPAEFPRRLRLQIFQWLASMPVELEGYIRPGCTILTAFIAMPKFMWVKLFEDPLSYIHDFVVAPGRMLSGRGAVLVYLNDTVFHVMEDGTTVMNVKVKMRAPKLHYIHPMYFEAGKPMEFIACGSNLLQHKFRFLVSFSGKYLKHDYCVASAHDLTAHEIACNSENQLYKIHISHTEPNLSGPMFIEVENESGLSNFIPVLIGDKDICAEIKIMQEKFDAFLLSIGSEILSVGSLCQSCKASSLRHRIFSDLILDVAWLLKEPASENHSKPMTSMQIQRFCCLLEFLISNNSTAMLEKVVRNLEILTENIDLNNLAGETCDASTPHLFECMDYARDVLSRRPQKRAAYSEPKGDRVPQSCPENNMPSVVPFTSQATEVRTDFSKSVFKLNSTFPDRSVTIPLLNKEVVMDVNHARELPRQPCQRYFSTGFLRSRPIFLVIASVTICFGLCAALFHPHKVSEFAVTVRRCLFDRTKT